MTRGAWVAAVLTLVATPAWAELPAVEAAAANLSVFRPPPRDDAADMAVIDRRGRPREVDNRAAGVPGTRVRVLFPAGSAELDGPQQHALHMLTRQWRDDPAVQMLWVRAGGEAGLARKRAEALRRATGGKGFPWQRIWLDPVWQCAGDDCDRQGMVTVIERR